MWLTVPVLTLKTKKMTVCVQLELPEIIVNMVSFRILKLIVSYHDCCLIAIDCGCLENPKDGTVELTGTTYNSEAVYSCNTGYRMIGNRMRTCSESGVWSGALPMCTGETCTYYF